jgi:hypothetical protein
MVGWRGIGEIDDQGQRSGEKWRSVCRDAENLQARTFSGLCGARCLAEPATSFPVWTRWRADSVSLSITSRVSTILLPATCKLAALQPLSVFGVHDCQMRKSPVETPDRDGWIEFNCCCSDLDLGTRAGLSQSYMAVSETRSHVSLKQDIVSRSCRVGTLSKYLANLSALPCFRDHTAWQVAEHPADNFRRQLAKMCHDITNVRFDVSTGKGTQIGPSKQPRSRQVFVVSFEAPLSGVDPLLCAYQSLPVGLSSARGEGERVSRLLRPCDRRFGACPTVLVPLGASSLNT